MGETNSFVAKNTSPNRFGKLESAIADPNNRSNSLGGSAVRFMDYVDAHLHLADQGYAGELQALVEDAERNRVSPLLSNATDYNSSIETIAIAKQFPVCVLAAIGVHPYTVTYSTDLYLDKFSELIDENADWITAIGEIGLDGKYSSDENVESRQMQTFRFFLKLAEVRGIPVVVHSRQATQEVLTSLAEYHLSGVLLHWYDGPMESLDLIRARKYFISVGPALLYSRRIAQIARVIDLDRILTETDGPVKYRALFGEQVTKPSLVMAVVRKLAEIRATDPETLRRTIVTNFEKFIPTALHAGTNRGRALNTFSDPTTFKEHLG